MKRHTNGSPGKAFADGYAKGKAEAADTIRQLQAALNKALAENLAMRPKPETLNPNPGRKMSDFDVWHLPCGRCGFDPGKGASNSCWKCGFRLQRDFTDRALKPTHLDAVARQGSHAAISR